MSAYFTLPYALFRFWFVEAPLEMILFFGSFNRALLHWLSLPVLFETFLKPLKNEYREGFVGFSIGMGIAIKSVLIVVDLLVFLVILALEVLAVIIFFFLPFLSLFVLFAGGSL